ncbi:MAG: inositol monophosphatase [Gammaproteobacteria bacterium]|nr:inositol monophosphatase [Gammaproteobacteria bacterium]
MHPMLNTAVKAARRAGNIIMRHIDRLERLSIESKGRNDFVTDVDRMAENEIIDILRRAYPSHAFLAEESGSQTGDDFCWIIDPLDGTTNFLHGYPQFAVSIALQYKGRLEQGVIFDPHRNELFTTSRGQGAQMNDRRIRVSHTHDFRQALLGTGFPFKSAQHLELWIKVFRSVAPETSGVRRAGAAALDLAHVACGRFDGFWEFGLRPWDMAAGCLLIEEAGGLVSDPAGGRDHMATGLLIAGNPKIHPELLKQIRPHLPAEPISAWN